MASKLGLDLPYSAMHVLCLCLLSQRVEKQREEKSLVLLEPQLLWSGRKALLHQSISVGPTLLPLLLPPLQTQDGYLEAGVKRVREEAISDNLKNNGSLPSLPKCQVTSFLFLSTE